MSSPPAIGAVAPNTGKFTTLDATGDFKVVGHSSLDSADFVGNVHTSNASTVTFDGPVIINGVLNYTGQTQGTADNINIGQVAPGKGKFTTLEATGGITGTLTGNALTSIALAGNPADCAANNFATAIDAGGNLTCAQVTSSGISGSLTQNTSGNAATATALASNPTDCSAGQFANAIDAGGNLTCAAVTAGVTSQMGSFALACNPSPPYTYTITGLSFQPSLVAFIAGDGGGGNGVSVGWDNGSNVSGTGYHDATSIQSTHYAAVGHSFDVNNGAGASCLGNITSWNSTSMTVTVTITGTPGAKTLDWVAFK